ncbi:MAG: DNA polymerase III subunit delta [Synergistes sp.]|nr:DNA polymerase III subunit delta [Synergistes sp.]
MAYYDKKNEEHAFRTFGRMAADAKNGGPLPRVLLLCGKEDFLVDWAAKEIRNIVVEPAVAELDCSVFSEDGCTADDVIAACETVPLMSSKKLVIIESMDILSAAKPSDMNSADVQALTDYIPQLPESCLLMFVSPKADKRKAICKAIAKTGLVYDFKPLDDSSLISWMQKRLSSAGRSASKGDMLRFAKNSGYGDAERSYSLYNLENDLKKLFALTDNKYLSAEDFSAAGEGEPETAAFAILDAAFSGRKGYALTVLHNSIDSQLASKETGIVLQFLGLLCSQLEIMLEAAERKNEGQSQQEIESGMKVNPYRLRKAQAAAAGRGVEKLREDLFRAFQIEKDLKTGFMDPRLELELFIAGL